MKRLLILTIIFGFTFLIQVRAQELVVNGGFESYSSLPVGSSEWYKCNSWNNVNMSTIANVAYGTPDYYNANSLTGAGYKLPSSATGYINAHTGTAIMGFLTDNNNTANFREYLSNTLASPMIVGTTYTVSFWLSNAEGTATRKYGESTNGIGVKFSTSALTQSPTNGVIVTTPQLEIPGLVWNDSWTLYSFTYTPTTAWTRITIGNFKNDANTLVSTVDPTATYTTGAYYYIDDVSIMPINPLSVELSSFIAFQQDEDVEMEWTTASENNNDYFTVEHSSDLNEWQLISKVDGAGNATTENKYSLTDRNPVRGVNYYRLNQIDYDGKINFSGIRVANTENDESPIIYPNPTIDKITIEANWKVIEEYKIIDEMGRDLTSMISIAPGSNKFSKEFDLSLLPKGVYYFISNESKQKIIRL